MICQILATQIASVVESGNLGQLLWRDPLKHDTDDLMSRTVWVRCDGCMHRH